MWYPSEAGWWWAPLPSRVLKFGKSLRSPTELFDLRTVPKAARYAAGARAFLALQSSAYEHFAQAPVLRALVAKTRGVTPALRVHDPLEMATPWRISASGQAPRLAATAMQTVAARYGCAVADVEGLERLILSATPFAFVRHPLFELMARVDYG
jgi:hypothetical protein